MIFAYLDPGSGSLILQAVLGGVAGLGVAAKAMRNRWKTRGLDRDANAENAEGVAEAESAPADHQES